MIWTRALHRVGMVATSSAVAGVIVTEAPPQRKLAIYPEPESEIVLVDTPSVLETQIGAARKAVTSVTRDVHAQVHGVVSKWIGVEHAVENRVKSLIAPDEPLTPGLLYVGVASLTGSILARNRSIFSRVLLPPTFLYLSFKYFLPKTTQNVSAYAGSLEEKHFPVLAQKHAVAIAHSHMTWERLREAGVGGRDKLQDGLGGAVRKFQELTGLKVEEALGHRTGVVNKVVEKVEEALQSTSVPPAEAGQSTEKTTRGRWKAAGLGRHKSLYCDGNIRLEVLAMSSFQTRVSIAFAYFFPAAGVTFLVCVVSEPPSASLIQSISSTNFLLNLPRRPVTSLSSAAPSPTY
ncbi:apolipo protein O-domain-containing protein [Lactarius indigo]|nr:apolipo protein O-domain-containing protein [Lactarius indigo]